MRRVPAHPFCSLEGREVTLRPSSRRAKPRWLALAGVVAVLLIWAASSALAVHQEGLFELDLSGTAPNIVGNANTVDSPAGGADDWDNVYHTFLNANAADKDHA